MRLMTAAANSQPSSTKLSLSLATTAEEVREVQRLRYQVFIEAMGLSTLTNQEGIDADAYDDCCDHLIVRDTKTFQVVGTYRILGPQSVRDMGRYYSETEFDLSPLNNLRGSIAEAGRACIHPDYRSGGVILMLWAGLAAYMQRERCEYLIGCASVSLSDGGHNAAALYHSLQTENIAPLEYRVKPHVPFPLADRDASARPTIPPLIKGYLRSGAWICGEPAWDPDFHTADFFMMLPLARLDARYARHYLKEESAVA